METPEEIAAREAAEDDAATGGFEDDLEVTPAAEPAEPVEDGSDDEVEVPEGAKNPDAVKRLIQEERKRARQANARARDLEAQLRDRDAAPQENPAEKQTREAAEARALRLEVALDKGISKTLALRLQGATREEMEADAETLLAEVGARRPGPGMEGGYRQDPPPPKPDPKTEHNSFIAGILRDAQAHRQQ